MQNNYFQSYKYWIEKYKHVVTRSVHRKVKGSIIGFELLGPIECGDILMACTDGIIDVSYAVSITEVLYSNSIDEGIKTIKDRDEFPPAVINTNAPVSVKLINSSDNRGAGSSIGNQIKNLPDGTPVLILPKDTQGSGL